MKTKLILSIFSVLFIVFNLKLNADVECILKFEPKFREIDERLLNTFISDTKAALKAVQKLNFYCSEQKSMILDVAHCNTAIVGKFFYQMGNFHLAFETLGNDYPEELKIFRIASREKLKEIDDQFGKITEEAHNEARENLDSPSLIAADIKVQINIYEDYEQKYGDILRIFDRYSKRAFEELRKSQNQ